MIKRASTFFVLLLIIVFGFQLKTANSQTFCNPMNLSYPFRADKPSGLNLSEPTVALYKDNYYLFASNAGGYWSSNDLLNWKFLAVRNLTLENREPTVAIIGDWMYLFTSFGDSIFRSKDPANGKWEFYSTSVLLSLIGDFAVFADTDGRVYCYYGCTNNDGVMARELDPKDHLKPLGVPVVCSKINPFVKGKKVVNQKAGKSGSTYVKGSWMNKYNGKYYYQSAEQSVDQTRYCDVVYVSDKPLGPFTFAANNPVSFRPDGFACGAGSGSTFADKYGNWWHIATLTGTVNHDSPSRLGLFPAGFDKDGNLFAKTDFGDYPMILPNQKYTNINKLDPEWSLLSDHFKAQASSSLATCPVASAFDENMGTYWSAKTGEKGEWLSVDLGSDCTINAIQLNFAENKTNIVGKDGVSAYQYLVQYSNDNKNWKTLIDRTSNTEYQPNPYEVMKTPVQAQYLKITNYRVPEGAFAISGFRIFGSGIGRSPKKGKPFRTIRDYHNPQIIKLFWEKQADATGYNIRYGIDKDKLYHSYQVYKKNRLTIKCPDRDKIYWIEIDAFNENGITPGKPQLSH